MFKNIKNNNIRSLKIKLRNDEYYDFMIYKGESLPSYISDDCIVAEITPDSEKDGKYISNKVWSDSLNNGVILDNIGFTGVDNGIISFRKDRISNADFLKLFTESKYVLNEKDKAFFMTPVSGNTQQYEYPYSIEEENNKKYFALKGGFLQGFYKIFGENYQTLPNVIDDEWNMEFVVRRKEYDVEEKSLNNEHPDNKGIFFYMGLRAENKFWESYNIPNKEEFVDDKLNGNDDCYDGNCEDEYFIEGYVNDDGYYADDISLDDVEINTSTGKDVTKHGYYEIETDNKFLTFDRTGKGFTVDTFDAEDATVIFEGIKEHKDANYFLLMDRTSKGYTAKNIHEYHEENKKEFNLFEDIKDNAFALKINNDGSVSYKYAMSDCDSENGCSFVEEFSKENLIPMDKWVTINLKIKVNGSSGTCGSKVGKRKMKLYIYVNGNLVLVSKELPEFRFRELNDLKEKQETVPFNISLGGGTQGLADGIWLDYDRISEYILPLEKNFSGSFIGDIMSFRFYTCFIDHKAINDRVFKG